MNTHHTDETRQHTSGNGDDVLAYTVEQAAKKLQLGRTSAYVAARRGEIPTIRLGNRLLVPRVALERLLSGVGQSV